MNAWASLVQVCPVPNAIVDAMTRETRPGRTGSLTYGFEATYARPLYTALVEVRVLLVTLRLVVPPVFPPVPPPVPPPVDEPLLKVDVVT